MKHPTMSALGIAAAALLLTAGAAGASIALELTSTAGVEGDTLAVEVAIENVGDETAYSLVPAVGFDGRFERGDVHPELASGETLHGDWSLPFLATRQGRWPAVLTVDYADGNGYLLQALQVFLVQAGQPPPGGLLVAAIEAPELAERGKLRVAIKNMTAVGRQADLELFTPRGIEAGGTPIALSLDPWAEESLVLDLINRSALPGSRLPVFAVLEWDDEEAHQTAVGSAVVEVVERRAERRRYRLLAIVGAALLVLAGAVFWLRRRTSERMPVREP